MAMSLRGGAHDKLSLAYEREVGRQRGRQALMAGGIAHTRIIDVTSRFHTPPPHTHTDPWALCSWAMSATHSRSSTWTPICWWRSWVRLEGERGAAGGVALPMLGAWWRSRVCSEGKGGAGEGVALPICTGASWDTSSILSIYTGITLITHPPHPPCRPGPAEPAGGPQAQQQPAGRGVHLHPQAHGREERRPMWLWVGRGGHGCTCMCLLNKCPSPCCQ